MAKQDLFENIFSKQYSITQYTGICKQRLQFYLSPSSTDSTRAIAYEFKDLLVTGKDPESIVARNKKIYQEAKEMVVRNNPNIQISDECYCPTGYRVKGSNETMYEVSGSCEGGCVARDGVGVECTDIEGYVYCDDGANCEKIPSYT